MGIGVLSDMAMYRPTDELTRCSISGDLNELHLTDADGNKYDLTGKQAVALCRCGASVNKPFCDGSHNRVGFTDQVVARELPPPKPKV